MSERRLMTDDETTLNVQWVGHYSMQTIERAWKAFDRVLQKSPERAGIEGVPRIAPPS
jgi:hypothetical protein